MSHLPLRSASLLLVAALGGCAGGLGGLNETMKALHTHPDPATRARAARRLGKPRLFLGKYKMLDTHLAWQCLEHLRRALDDEDRQVCEAAENSMSVWRRWLQDHLPRKKPGHNPRIEPDAAGDSEEREE